MSFFVPRLPDGLWAKIDEDLDDLWADAEAEHEGKPKTRFKDCDNCTAKLDFSGERLAQTCAECELKDSLNPWTERGLFLHGMIDAGCTFSCDELSLEEWNVLMHITKRLKAKQLEPPAEVNLKRGS